MKKILKALTAFALSVVTVLGVVSIPATSAWASTTVSVVSFADVPGDAPFAKEISWLAAQEISTGWVQPDGSRLFKPLDAIGRDAMAAFLYRYAGKPSFTAPSTSPFTDVPTSYPFYKEITWLASRGITTGWDAPGGKKEFRPTASIGRDAIAAFLYRDAGKPSFTAPGASPFTDVPTSYPFYKEITWLASSGVTTGYDDGGGSRSYHPVDPIARNAMAAFLYRYAASKEPADPSDPSGPTVTVAPDVKVLDDAALAGGSTSGDSVTLPASAASKIRPGDVLAAGITTTTPDGLLARVTAVTTTPGGATVLSTAPATLADAIVTTNGPIEVPGVPVSSSFTPDSGDVTETTSPTARSRSISANPTIFSTSFNATFRLSAETPGTDASDTLTGSGAVNISAKVTASASAHLTLDLGFLGVKEASVIVTPKTKKEQSVKVSGTLAGTHTTRLGAIDSVFTFAIGVVPVVVNNEIKLTNKLSLKGAAEVAYSESGTVSSDQGFRYKNGNFELIRTAPKLTSPSSDVKANASLTVEDILGIDAKLKFYGVAGFTAGLGVYANIGIVVDTIKNSWTCPIELGLRASVGITAGISVLGFKLKEWNASITGRWAILDVDPCKGTAVTPPPPPGPTPTPTGAPTPTPTPTETQAPTVALKDVTAVAGGGMAGYALQDDGTVWAWGNGGALGSGSTADSTVPVQVAGLSGVTAVSGGASTGYALRGDGTVWAWGSGIYGQLGTEGGATSAVPVQVAGLSGATAVASGIDTGYALLGDGTVWAWGYNGHGELGNGSTGESAVPVRVDGLSDIIAIAGGGLTGYALRGDGTVWAWGAGAQGRLGNGSTAQSLVPVQVSGLSGVTAIAGGGQTGYALRDDATVWAWGYNGSGELGNGSTTESSTTPVQIVGLAGVTAIAGGGRTGYASLGDGTVWAWGLGQAGELGNGSAISSVVPVQVTGVSGATAVAGGSSSGYALHGDGTVWAWGWNRYGQLGDGTTTDSAVPVRVGG